MIILLEYFQNRFVYLGEIKHLTDSNKDPSLDLGFLAFVLGLFTSVYQLEQNQLQGKLNEFHHLAEISYGDLNPV